MIIAIDFDGSCVDHKYLYIGADVPGAFSVLQEIVAAGHRLILFTMRSTSELDPTTGRTTIDEAVQWFQTRGIPLFGVNENPEQEAWSVSRKVYAQLYIDDAALGCPLQLPPATWPPSEVTPRPIVDWFRVREMLVIRGILP
jgi:hypothetical protein